MDGGKKVRPGLSVEPFSDQRPECFGGPASGHPPGDGAGIETGWSGARGVKNVPALPKRGQVDVFRQPLAGPGWVSHQLVFDPLAMSLKQLSGLSRPERAGRDDFQPSFGMQS